MDLASLCRRQLEDSALRKIGRRRGIPDTPDQEGPSQKRRKRRVVFYFGLLLLLSIGVELYNRGISLQEVLDGLVGFVTAFFAPTITLPQIDWLDLIWGIISIMRNMVPPIVVLWLVLRLGADFVKGVYGLSSADASAYLNTSLFGSLSGERLPEVTSKLALSWTLEELMGGEIGGGGPFVIVDNGTVQGRNSHDPAMRVGGPGSLIVSPDSAVLLERAGQLTRVVGPGVHPLQRFEKVRDVLNVRPLHQRTVKVNGMSREGIPVEWPVDVQYRIGDEGDGFHPATERQPYAFSEDAALQASASRLMREPDASKHLDWGDLMAGAAEGILRGIMARYPLDRLLRPLYDGEALPREEIERELESALLAFAASQGLILVQVDLQNIELKDPVAQQLVERWRADWTKLMTEELALGEAERAYQLQRIRSEAQGMLTAIAEGLERWDGPPRSPAADIVSLRLIETLRHIVTQPHALGQMAYPPNLRQAWDRLRRLIASSTSGE